MRHAYARVAITVRREEPNGIRFIWFSEKLSESSEIANSQFEVFLCCFSDCPAEEGWRQRRTAGKVWVPSSSHLHAEPNFASSSLGHSAQRRRPYVLISKSLKWECLSTSEVHCSSWNYLQKAPSTVPAVTIKWYVSLLFLLIKLGAMINIPYQCFVKVRWRKINLN